MMKKLNESLRITPWLRSIILLSSLATLLFIFGCATATLAMNASGKNRTSTKITSNIIDNDMVYAVGAPTSPELLNTFPDALCIVGEKNTYVMTTNGEILKKIIGKFDPEHITLHRDKAIRLEVDDKKFKGSVRILYERKWSDMSPEEQAIIAQYNFRTGSENLRNYYYKTVEFEGFIAPQATNFAQIKSTFSKPRSVQLYEIERKTTTKRDPNLDAIFLLPVTVTFDLMTAPIQVLLFSMKNS